jgi:hypothetical protein
MTDQTETRVPPEYEKHSDFWWRLKEEGVVMKHVREMLDRISQERAEETAKAARLYYGNEEGEAVSSIVLADKLYEMTSRCWGIVVALEGLFKGHADCETRGVLQFANDVAREITRLYEASKAERTLESASKVEA